MQHVSKASLLAALTTVLGLWAAERPAIAAPAATAPDAELNAQPTAGGDEPGTLHWHWGRYGHCRWTRDGALIGCPR